MKKVLHYCSYAFWRFVVTCLALVLFRLETFNRGKVPKKGGYMLISNHASFADPVLVGGLVGRHLHYLAKRELFEIPVFGPAIRSVNAHPIRRDGLDRNAMKECIDVMKAGEILVIFPEGTRTRDGELQPVKGGPAMLAAQAGVQCIPAYIDGSFEAWPRSRKLPRPKKVRVYYGDPFPLPDKPEGMSTRDYYSLCADEMIRRIESLRPPRKG